MEKRRVEVALEKVDRLEASVNYHRHRWMVDRRTEEGFPEGGSEGGGRDREAWERRKDREFARRSERMKYRRVSGKLVKTGEPRVFRNFFASSRASLLTTRTA